MDEKPTWIQITAFVGILLIIVAIFWVFKGEPQPEGVYVVPYSYKDFTNKTGVVENSFQMNDLPTGSVNIVVFTPTVYSEHEEIRCILNVNGIKYDLVSYSEDDTIWVYENYIMVLGTNYQMSYNLVVR